MTHLLCPCVLLFQYGVKSYTRDRKFFIEALTEFCAICFVFTCSARFEETILYTKNLGISAAVILKRKLVAGAILSIASLYV